MTVIFLLWRRIKDRQSENHFNVVENQLRDGLFHIESKIGKVLFWLTSQFGQWDRRNSFSGTSTEMHEFIRETVRKALEVTLLKRIYPLRRKRKTR
jgi:triosephosphate isomerase